MTPSAKRAAAMAAKIKSAEVKREENQRAYQRRKERERLKEIARKGGQTYLTRTAEATRTPDALKWAYIGHRKEKPQNIQQRIPENIIIPIREYIDTPEDRAEVARILAKKTN